MRLCFWRKPKEVFWERKFHKLADYNGEVARGILHTDEWRELMADMQDYYNRKMQRFHKENL